MTKWIECSPMVRETWVQSQVTSYQRTKMVPPCSTLSNIRYVSRVNWNNPWKKVAPSPTPRCSSYWKGSFWSPSTTVANFTFYLLIMPVVVMVSICPSISYCSSPLSKILCIGQSPPITVGIFVIIMFLNLISSLS